MTKNTLTWAILAAMLLGIITGEGVRLLYPDPATLETFAGNISLLSDVFMRLIKTIIAPLVFSTLVVGIAKLGDLQAIGRLGGKTLFYFLAASLASLTLGLILVNLFQPGIHMHLPLPADSASAGLPANHFDLKNFLHHLIPENLVEAMGRNEMLQIVMFSVFFGVAAATTGDRGEPIIAALDAVGHVMLRVTGYVMLFAPLAVFGAAAGVIAQKGLGVLATYGLLIGEFYLALVLLWGLLVLFGFLIIGGRVKPLLSRLRGPFLLAFSTASSEAAFPKTLQELERFGCPNRIASFVLPLGYSFNLDGSMMYMTFAALFIAQAYGIPLAFEQQITMLLTLMLTSKGIAGVPRASLVVIAGALSLFDIPEAGLLLLLPIDHFLDMGRSATNVLGNAVATTVLSKWEGQLRHH
jgi:Na+/H+-dicarboxylate symporter